MMSIVKKLSKNLEALAEYSTDRLDSFFNRQDYSIIITGLSRSGKSMLFTSLMTLLREQGPSRFDALPLLKKLPKDLFSTFELKPILGEECFPFDESLERLQLGKWPKATEEIYGFELVVTLRPNSFFSKTLNLKDKIVFRFYDYPGEWLTDLPMLDKTYRTWSDSAWSQQLNPPQKQFARVFQDYVDGFDFHQIPTPELIGHYVAAFKYYLESAKKGGISLLQPGAMLIDNQKIDLIHRGFAPLPSRISSDPSHPWTQCFTAHFEDFQTLWLIPLKEAYFSKADKQIILVDLLEGLNHSQDHLNQLKESISNLASNFVYAAEKWYKPKFLSQDEISKVAFVATKMDLLPPSQHNNALALLQELTTGVRAHLKDQEVEFQHFVVSALQATNPGEQNDSLQFLNGYGQTEQWEFDPLPRSIAELQRGEHYPMIECQVPKDVVNRIYHAQGIDRLMNYLLEK